MQLPEKHIIAELQEVLMAARIVTVNLQCLHAFGIHVIVHGFTFPARSTSVLLLTVILNVPVVLFFIKRDASSG